jgi:DNA-binding response OmpR family regulator
MGARVLLAEDDRSVREALTRALELEGHDVQAVADGEAALAALDAERPDVVLLDWMMPVLDGLSVCRQLRSAGDRIPVLILTARAEIGDRVTGLDAGADDYLPKPFAFAELVARVRALGRRTTPAAPPVMTAGDLELDSAKRTVTRSSEMIDLTRKEFGVLETLLTAQGAVVSSEELLDRVWDENADPFTTTVRVTMMTLRRKLGEPAIIDTVVGSGYRIDPELLTSAPEGAGTA